MTPLRFRYDRNRPPLFFAPKHQKQSSSMIHIGREYFSRYRKYKISHLHLLSNGMTAGEFAMYLVTVNHQKRFPKRKVRKVFF
jgi:hypothetical protein